MLDAKATTGVELTTSMAMWPASSVSRTYITHPEAYYFGVAKAVCDQVQDYAIRKSMDFSEAKRWLALILNYIPVSLSETAAGCDYSRHFR